MQTCKSVWYFLSYSGFKSRPSFSMTLYIVTCTKMLTVSLPDSLHPAAAFSVTFFPVSLSSVVWKLLNSQSIQYPEIVLTPNVDCVWNVMAHTQKPDFVFRRNGLVHLNRRERQFCLLLAAEVCASAGVMLDTSCSGVVWRVLATHSVRQFPLHFPSRASPCAITFQLQSTRRVGQKMSYKYTCFGFIFSANYNSS